MLGFLLPDIAIMIPKTRSLVRTARSWTRAHSRISRSLASSRPMVDQWTTSCPRASSQPTQSGERFMSTTILMRRA